MTWEELISKAKKPEERFKGRLLTLDPGETTGWSFWFNDECVNSGQEKTWEIEAAIIGFNKLLDQTQPTGVVFEEYRIYSWKADDHIHSDVPALQVIGCLKTLLIQRNIPFSTQTAQVAKQFCSDEKIKEWGFWNTGQRHARDAIRHGCYYQLFGKHSSNHQIPS